MIVFIGRSVEFEFEANYRASTEVIESRLLKEVVRPGGLELPTFWFVAIEPI